MRQIAPALLAGKAHPKRAGSWALLQGGTMTEPLVGIIMGSRSDW
jgi:hypothetical protein